MEFRPFGNFSNILVIGNKYELIFRLDTISKGVSLHRQRYQYLHTAQIAVAKAGLSLPSSYRPAQSDNLVLLSRCDAQREVGLQRLSSNSVSK